MLFIGLGISSTSLNAQEAQFDREIRIGYGFQKWHSHKQGDVLDLQELTWTVLAGFSLVPEQKSGLTWSVLFDYTEYTDKYLIHGVVDRIYNFSMLIGYNWKANMSKSGLNFNIRAELGITSTWNVDVWSHRRFDVTDIDTNVGLPYRISVSGPNSWWVQPGIQYSGYTWNDGQIGGLQATASMTF